MVVLAGVVGHGGDVAVSYDPPVSPEPEVLYVEVAFPPLHPPRELEDRVLAVSQADNVGVLEGLLGPYGGVYAPPDDGDRQRGFQFFGYLDRPLVKVRHERNTYEDRDLYQWYKLIEHAFVVSFCAEYEVVPVGV